MNKIRDWLIHPHLPIFVTLIAVCLSLPSLWNGFNGDDIFYRLVLLNKMPGAEYSFSFSNLFRPNIGGVEQTYQLKTSGFFP